MTAPSPASSNAPEGPLSTVLAAVGNGASSLDAVARATGLPRDVVDAAVHHLVRAGRLSTAELALGCPADGCVTCPSGRARHSCPVLVAFTVR